MENEEVISLERMKLALEIADLERPWWKRPAYVLAALPTMLAFGTLLVGAFSGYFQAAYTKLENQRHDLEAQVKDFEAKRDELHRQYDDAKKAVDDAKKAIEERNARGRDLFNEANFQAERAQKCEDELGQLKTSRK